LTGSCNRSKRLAKHPWSGRIVPEFNDPLYREIFVYSYRVIYRVQDDEVRILYVLHGAMLLDDEEPEK